ncbi:MAG: ASCH domain-containing protein [Desulfurococcales archaeon]|nr:ASCH domain-containing protein [Desulfurococcales archaeon]
MIKGAFADKLLEGRKSTTIRLGVVKPRYREVIIHGHGRPLAKAEVVGVRVKKVSELTEEDAWRDGFRSLEDLLEALRRVYGDFSPDDPVTIIELRVKQRLDQLDASDPYLGLEPADIARLALRYLREELSEEEARILEDLTRTNSIRSTAVRLYGSIERRFRVRRALRRALNELLRRGLIRAGRLR